MVDLYGGWMTFRTTYPDDYASEAQGEIDSLETKCSQASALRERRQDSRGIAGVRQSIPGPANHAKNQISNRQDSQRQIKLPLQLPRGVSESASGEVGVEVATHAVNPVLRRSAFICS